MRGTLLTRPRLRSWEWNWTGWRSRCRKRSWGEFARSTTRPGLCSTRESRCWGDPRRWCKLRGTAVKMASAAMLRARKITCFLATPHRGATLRMYLKLKVVCFFILFIILVYNFVWILNIKCLIFKSCFRRLFYL